MGRRRRRRGHEADAGVALPFVLGLMFILTSFMLSALALVLNNMAPSRSDQDSRAALAAAQAGIDEYLARLSVDSEYWDRNNVDAANPAFSAAGAVVPGTGADAARFRYRLVTDSATTAQEGYIVLEVTGTARPPGGGRTVSRTLTTRLEPTAFLDFIYFTNYEVVDPALLGSNSVLTDACTRHYYDSWTYNGTTYPTRIDEAPNEYCSRINWVAGDVLDGPVHTNDALYVASAVRFADPRTESSWVKTTDPTRLWRGPGTPTTGTATAPGYLPRYAAPLDLPDANTELLAFVQPRTDTSPNPDTPAARPGCLYRGATRITFEGDRMKVFSPNTTDAPDRCLTTSNRGSEQTKAIPEIVYVAPATGTCVGVGYPRAGEDTSGTRTTNYGPCRGTAFVQGTVDGRVTVSAEDDIVVTANLRLADAGAGTDIVGLVAGNNVWVYHPINAADGTNLLPSAEAVRNIEAAIVSLRHSFVVQNYHRGAILSDASQASKLRIFGSVSQQFRGPVGGSTTQSGVTTPHGYLKNYVYDERLQVLQPPYFVMPDNAPWKPVRVTDG